MSQFADNKDCSIEERKRLEQIEVHKHFLAYYEHQKSLDPKPDTVLWRYINFTKFVSLLETESLFFSRADKLGDPFEGSATILNKLANRLQVTVPPEGIAQMEEIYRRVPRVTLVSCWHESDRESEVMWRLYSGETEGIAIKTSFSDLKNRLGCKKKIIAKRITYIDHKEGIIPVFNMFARLLHKRESFKYDQEVRLLWPKWSVADGKMDLSQDADIGEYCEVDLSQLIKEIVVAPFAPDWFLELVRKIASRHISIEPVRSKLLTDPIF